MEIKRLTQSDLDVFHNLKHVFEVVFAGEEEFKQTSDEYLLHLLQQESFFAYVAIEDEQVIGAATGYLLPKYHSESSYLYLFDIGVLPEYQRKGIGQALLTFIQDEAKQHGVEEVFVQADKDDEHAISFYKKTGGQPEEVIHFSYPIDLP